MDSRKGAGTREKQFSPHSLHHHHYPNHPHHHHRHHHLFYISPFCPLHTPILRPNNHSPSCSFSTSNSYSQNTVPVDSVPQEPNLIFSDLQTYETLDHASMVLDESAELELEDELDEEPIFVLTDEWRDFFAKSEAKRKLAKKQAKKKNKS